MQYDEGVAEILAPQCAKSAKASRAWLDLVGAILGCGADGADGLVGHLENHLADFPATGAGFD